jgi:DNA (cytosine-5)-methyltransferase 1
MKQPILVDLFCGGGGCSVGYYRAGFRVIGVDNKPSLRKNYPFEFHCCEWDSEEALQLISKADAIHASPPCKGYSVLAHLATDKNRKYKIIEAVRKVLQDSGKPFVVENVKGALRADVILTGQMFGLKVLRERHFELGGWFMLCPPPTAKIGTVKNGDLVSVSGNGGYSNEQGWKAQQQPIWSFGSVKADWSEAMGIDWMSVRELSQAIPPAYTQFIGEHLMNYLCAK